MGSTLEPALASIFKVKYERSLFPQLSKYIKHKKWYVDNTIALAKILAMDHI